jgi:hypothetical protein
LTIINNSYSFIFIHVPKAAGTSVTNALSKFTHYCDLEIGGTSFGEKIQSLYRNRFGLYKHAPAKEIRAIVGHVNWAKYFTFSVVRHPADRLLSTFNFLQQWKGTPEDLKDKLKSFKSFDKFVRSEIWKLRSGPDNIFFPQIHWLTEKEIILIDYVAKLENLEEGLYDVFNIIFPNKRTKIKLKKLNQSGGNKSYHEISKEAKILINDYYKIDFELLGYERLKCE